MTPHSLTAVILVAGMVVVGWGIVWHERWCARRVARRQHPSNWAPETDAAIDEAIDVTRRRFVAVVDDKRRCEFSCWLDLDTGRTFSIANDAESYLRGRQPRRF